MPTAGYRGRVVLLVNTASRCGFTNQYRGLEALWRRYKDRGLVVLGVPSNDFGGQEPGSNDEIKRFCAATFDVTFPLADKQIVCGSGAHPLYRWAAARTGSLGTPNWNFHKILIGRDGRVIDWFSALSGTGRKLDRAIEAARLKRENEELRSRAGLEYELLGQSTAVNHSRQQIERVAPTGSRVLIVGPAGCGKEVAARLLHLLSKRAGGPFVVVNCAAMRADRLEIELFGSESLGDRADGPSKVGTLEQAHGGTLLLDEVADMPLETQGKIVRALQEQTFERVGGSRRVEVDVRVVASSNREL